MVIIFKMVIMVEMVKMVDMVIVVAMAHAVKPGIYGLAFTMGKQFLTDD